MPLIKPVASYMRVYLTPLPLKIEAQQRLCQIVKTGWAIAKAYEA